MLALLLQTALAQNLGYSADIELLNPTMGARALPGVDLPRSDGAGSVRAGLLLQYQDDPLTVYDAARDEELGAVVSRRTAGALGLSWDLSDRFTIQAALPGAASWQTEVPELSGDGAGVGDLAVGGRWLGLTGRTAALGLQADLRLPTSPANAWLGERGVRVHPTLLASADLGPLTLAAQPGLLLRTDLTTTEDLSLGNEATLGAGARLDLPAATRTSFTASLLGRTALDRPLSGGETPVEALAGVQLRPTRDLTVDVAAGRGMTEGYGTTDLRLVSAVRMRFPAPEPPPEVRALPPRPPPPPTVDTLDDPPDPPVDFGDRNVVVTATSFALAQQPRFVVGQATLLDSSRPLLAEVAGLFRDHPEIAHVVIEGHASQEGSTAYNYALSLDRAHAIYQALVELGVDGDRISIRGRGEVEPLDPGTGEAALERNRRVVFTITHRHASPPASPGAQTVPWSGAIRPVAAPPAPAPSPAPEPVE